MEPDELERYMALKDRCTDIATEIYPHFKDMYPGGVKETTALDAELSEEAQAVKLRWFEKILERFMKLQSRRVWPSFRHCAVSNFIPSTFLLIKGPCCADCFSEATCTDATCTSSSSYISCCKEEHVNGGKSYGSGTILEILHPRNMARGETVAPKRACGRF